MQLSGLRLEIEPATLQFLCEVLSTELQRPLAGVWPQVINSGANADEMNGKIKNLPSLYNKKAAYVIECSRQIFLVHTLC